MRHVGDGDDQAEAARQVRVRFGIDRVVEVAGVGAVDGDQPQVAQVGAAAGRRRRACRASSSAASGKTCGMSWVWMAIRLIARASPSLPSRSTTRAGFRPRC